MYNPGLMSCGQSRGYLDSRIQSYRQFHPGVGETLAKSHTIYKLGSYELRLLRLSDLIDREDVRMIQRRHRTGFLLETKQLLLAQAGVGEEQFERNGAS